MEPNSHFSWRKRVLSFRYAFRGMKILIADEHNARIHLCLTVVALVAGCLLRISLYEWCMVAGCIGAVFAGEAVNSAIEALADLVSPDFHPLVAKAKDVAAAAVLFLAITAAAIGCLIFIPKIVSLL